MTQLSRFFSGEVPYSRHNVLYAIRDDKSTEVPQWSKSALQKLLDPLRASVKATIPYKTAATKSTILSTSNGELKQLRLWRPKGVSLGLLKNIAYVACRSDVPDLNTALLLVNTQAVDRI